MRGSDYQCVSHENGKAKIQYHIVDIPDALLSGHGPAETYRAAPQHNLHSDVINLGDDMGVGVLDCEL